MYMLVVGQVGLEPTCNQLPFRHFIRVSGYNPILHYKYTYFF